VTENDVDVDHVAVLHPLLPDYEFREMMVKMMK
jgi:hypothetical protein